MRKYFKKRYLLTSLFILAGISLMPAANAQCSASSGSRVNYPYRFGQNQMNKPQNGTFAHITCTQDTLFVPVLYQDVSARNALTEIRRDLRPTRLNMTAYLRINDSTTMRYYDVYYDFANATISSGIQNLIFKKGIMYIVSFDADDPYIETSAVTNKTYDFTQELYRVGGVTATINGGFIPAPPELVCPSLRFSASVLPSPTLNLGYMTVQDLNAGKEYSTDFSIQFQRTETTCPIASDFLPQIKLIPTAATSGRGDINISDKGLLLKITHNSPNSSNPVVFNSNMSMPAMKPTQTSISSPFKATVRKNPNTTVKPGEFRTTVKFEVTYK